MPNYYEFIQIMNKYPFDFIIHSCNIMKWMYKLSNKFSPIILARLAQSVEHETLNLRVVGSSPTLGDQFCHFICFPKWIKDGRVVVCSVQWWRYTWREGGNSTLTGCLCTMCNLINYSGGAEKSFPSSTSFRQKLELWFGFGPKYVPKKITKSRSNRIPRKQ